MDSRGQGAGWSRGGTPDPAPAHLAPPTADDRTDEPRDHVDEVAFRLM